MYCRISVYGLHDWGYWIHGHRQGLGDPAPLQGFFSENIEDCLYAQWPYSTPQMRRHLEMIWRKNVSRHLLGQYI